MDHLVARKRNSVLKCRGERGFIDGVQEALMSMGVGNIIGHHGDLASHRPFLQVLRGCPLTTLPFPGVSRFLFCLCRWVVPKGGSPSLASHGPSLNRAQPVPQGPLLQVLRTEELSRPNANQVSNI